MKNQSANKPYTDPIVYQEGFFKNKEDEERFWNKALKSISAKKSK